jgi:microcompartment protein CcmK/EutM
LEDDSSNQNIVHATALWTTILSDRDVDTQGIFLKMLQVVRSRSSAEVSSRMVIRRVGRGEWVWVLGSVGCYARSDTAQQESAAVRHTLRTSNRIDVQIKHVRKDRYRSRVGN